MNGKSLFSETMKEYKKSILRIIDEQPTSDVAPKSEVAREIFEEIEKAFIKYYEKRVTYSDSTLLYHIREAVGFSLNEMFTEIAELKKRYTEEQQ